jgi:hypothetical protein
MIELSITTLLQPKGTITVLESVVEYVFCDFDFSGFVSMGIVEEIFGDDEDLK